MFWLSNLGLLRYLSLFVVVSLVVSGHASNVHVIHYTGTAIPGHDGVEVNNISIPYLHLSENGHFIAKATLKGDAVTRNEDDDAIIFVSPGGETQLLIRRGDFVVGVAPEGSQFKSADDVFVDAQGNVAFSATISIPGTFDNWAIFRGKPHNVEVVAYSGQMIGEEVLTVRNLILSQAGRLIFWGTLGGESFLWEGEPSPDKVVVAEEMTYNGMLAGRAFSGIDDDFAMSQDGGLLFTGAKQWKPPLSSLQSEPGMWFFNMNTFTVEQIIAYDEPLRD